MGLRFERREAKNRIYGFEFGMRDGYLRFSLSLSLSQSLSEKSKKRAGILDFVKGRVVSCGYDICCEGRKGRKESRWGR
jgi:hypothetical protein